jgi:hypothetical protein
VAAVPGTNRYLGTQYRPTNNNNNVEIHTVDVIGKGAIIAPPAHQTSRIYGCHNRVCPEATGLIVSACLEVKCNYEWCTMGTLYLIHLDCIPGSSSCTHHSFNVYRDLSILQQVVVFIMPLACQVGVRVRHSFALLT